LIIQLPNNKIRRKLVFVEITGGNWLVSKPYKSGRPVPSIDLDGTTDALVPFTDIQMTSLGILPPEPFLSDVQAIDK
jgi:hypothetical protein